MPREGVTYSEVAEVCERLSAEGVKPTQRNVRAEIGSGSVSTILRHINAWLESKSLVADVQVVLPDETVVAMQKAINDAIQSASETRDREIANLKEQIEDELKALTEQDERIQSLDNRLQAEAESAKARELALEKSLAVQTRQAEELKAQNAALSEKLESAVIAQEIARTESAKAQLHVERSEKAAEKAEARVDLLNKSLGKCTEALAQSEKEAATAVAVAAEQQKSISRLEKQLESAQQKYEVLLEKYEHASKAESAARALLEAKAKK